MNNSAVFCKTTTTRELGRTSLTAANKNATTPAATGITNAANATYNETRIAKKNHNFQIHTCAYRIRMSSTTVPTRIAPRMYTHDTDDSTSGRSSATPPTVGSARNTTLAPCDASTSMQL